MATSTTTTLITPGHTMTTDTTTTTNLCILKLMGKEEACPMEVPQETTEETHTAIIQHTEVVEMVEDTKGRKVVQRLQDMARDQSSIKEGQAREDPIQLK